jgi:hypothetical protein
LPAVTAWRRRVAVTLTPIPSAECSERRAAPGVGLPCQRSPASTKRYWHTIPLVSTIVPHILKPRPLFAPEAAVIELDRALLRAALPRSVLQSASAGPASTAMIAPIEAENTLQGHRQSSLQSKQPRSRRDSNAFRRYDAKIVGELSRRIKADRYCCTIIVLRQVLLNY